MSEDLDRKQWEAIVHSVHVLCSTSQSYEKKVHLVNIMSRKWEVEENGD